MIEKKTKKYCIYCNNILTGKRRKFCTDSCSRLDSKRKNNPNIKYWKYILEFLKQKNHFSINQITLNYYESIHGNNLKNYIRKDIIKKYRKTISGLIGFLAFENKLKQYNNSNQNKRYYVNNKLLSTIKLIIKGNYKGINRFRTLDIDNVNWIPFNELSTFSMYYLCNLDGKVDNSFREIYNNIIN